MPRNRRVDAQPVYILHTRPYRETSLLLEAFSRDYGRLALMARGARRPHSTLHGLLMAFQPLEVAWSGKGEILTLMRAEWQGGQPLLSGLPLFCGYYLNELLLRLLPREDAHPRLFMQYAKILLSLGHSPHDKVSEADLRSFERALLSELGYGLTLMSDVEGRSVQATARYRYEIERGSILLHTDEPEEGSFQGQTLLDMSRDDYSHPPTRLEAKQLMRRLLAYYLDGRELETRKWVKELQEAC
ncbi:MAG: DNA repair protein RecO [Zoogloeaceae bacterium]|jgi:DNA repair protein RecO (recombination protein O)|nr:DNA repair protein RecO [Zoogloeaceae bacterium]